MLGRIGRTQLRWQRADGTPAAGGPLPNLNDAGVAAAGANIFRRVNRTSPMRTSQLMRDRP